MTRILVVDDEPDLEALIRQKFRKKIKQNELDFLFAINGKKALELLKENNDVDLVLTDINMPEMDGLTLLKQLNDQDFFLKTVIVSAYGDMENIRTAMNLGAFDFITKPIDFQDLEVTMDKTIQHVFQLKESAETLRENDTLKLLLKEIESQKKLKDKFFAIISHDLRGPVSAFRGINYVLEKYMKSQKYDELENLIKEIDKSASNLSVLLDNLLNWASQEMGQISYNPEHISVKEMLDEIFNTYEAMAQAKNIKLDSKIEENAQIWADRNSAYTIFRNLVSNALKFTIEGGKVSVNQMKESKDKTTLVIDDNGVGIPKDKLNNIFKVFANKSTFGTKGEKGVGLGLQLVYEFTKLNKGSISVESEENKGSTFSVTLPSNPVKDQ
jgi:signal transduction histidine kinase